jgi:hypothetical protein
LTGVLDLLLAAVVFPLIVAIVLALLALVTLVPFVVALQMAEQRGFSTARWGAVAMVASLLALLGALLLLRSDSIATPAAALPLVFAAAGPGALWVLSSDQTGIGGRAGRHE